MIALECVAAVGSRSTISERAAISPSPKSHWSARHRVRRPIDYPAALGLDPKRLIGQVARKPSPGHRVDSPGLRRVHHPHAIHQVACELPSSGRHRILRITEDVERSPAGEVRLEDLSSVALDRRLRNRMTRHRRRSVAAVAKPFGFAHRKLAKRVPRWIPENRPVVDT